MTDGEGRRCCCSDGTSKGDLVDCREVAPRQNSDQRTRRRLPNRRPAETIAFERDGSRYRLTVGYFPSGAAGEVFLNSDRANSLLDFLTSDAAILASLALQYGAPLDEIRHALKRDARGVAASPICAALDQIR